MTSATRIAEEDSGKQLDADARGHFEPLFRHDFSHVRIHADAAAASSASALGADAYTAGRSIAFGRDQYQPHTTAGRRLLAHELAHVVQQRGAGVSRPTPRVAEPSDPREGEADAVADVVARGSPAPQMSAAGPPAVLRKLRVRDPANLIPNPGGTGVVQTNAQTFQRYLATISPEGGVRVDGTTGDVSLATGFCPGVLGGFLQGARSGFRIGDAIGSVGGRIPLLGPIFGAVGAVLGSVVGAVAGLFGAQSPSAAAASRTPTGSTCLCELVDDDRTVSLVIDDQAARPVGAESEVKVPSPNSPREWGTATVSGRLERADPWLILAHELCGHAWAAQRHRGDEEGPGRAPSVERDSSGQPYVSEADPYTFQTLPPPTADQYLRHRRTVERENLIRAEHGIEARGFRLRDPYCGESFWRPRGVPNAAVNWQEHGDPTSTTRTYLEQCELMRRMLPENRGGRYRIDQRIPGP